MITLCDQDPKCVGFQVYQTSLGSCSFGCAMLCSTLSTQSNSAYETYLTSPYAATSDAQQGCAELYCDGDVTAIVRSVGAWSSRISLLFHVYVVSLKLHKNSFIRSLENQYARITLDCDEHRYLTFKPRSVLVHVVSIQHSPIANLSGNPYAALDPLRVRVLRVDRTLRCPYLLFETRMWIVREFRRRPLL